MSTGRGSMEHTPLLDVLQGMKGTDKELDLVMMGDAHAIEVRTVMEVEPLPDSFIKITTKRNMLWVNTSHVSAAWQARTDL